MKRLVVAFALVLVFASCENSGSSAADQIKDSVDSVTNLKVESVKEAADEAIDTIKSSSDSLKNRIDEVAGEVADSLKN